MRNLSLKNKRTTVRRYRAGAAKSPALKTKRKTFSSDISANYAMMLQIYCLNKKEAAAKKELKCSPGRLPASAETKPSLSVYAAVMSFFGEFLFSFRKGKAGMAMATVTE